MTAKPLQIHFTNTLTRRKELFTPLHKNMVTLYVCGVTPYDHSHIGHGRSYVNFDVLVRFLRFVRFDVTYVRNVTDIDDKLLKRAYEELGDQSAYPAIAQKYTALYREDMKALNNLDPDIEPLATTHIEAMIECIDTMVKKGDAYIAKNDVYFDVARAKKYGKLSGKKLDELQAGARIEINLLKKNPFDFVLWKGNDERKFWYAPWGYGRPGWHIECSAMARQYLGDTIDIHGGGADLIFPHHENEIAQSQSVTDKPFSRFWLHNALLNLNKEKMSKSIGNTHTLRAIFEKFDPMVLRFYFLQHHYRTPIEFSFDLLESAQVAYKKLIKVFCNSQASIRDLGNNSLATYQENQITKKMIEALADDLNTPKALGFVFEHLDQIKQDSALASLVASLLCNLFGLTLEPLVEEVVKITPEIKTLITQRIEARAEKNWARADQIRDQLTELGYEVQDKKS